MAYALQFDGVNDYCATTYVIPSLLNVDFEVKASFSDLSNDKGLFGAWAGGDGQFQLWYDHPNSLASYFGGAALDVITSFIIDDVITVKVEIRNGTSLSMYLDGELIGQRSISNAGVSTVPLHIGSISANTRVMSGNIHYLSYTDLDDANNNAYWDATASDHSGSTGQPILTDTIGGNDATGVNFPAFDPSVWVNLGGDPIVVDDTASASLSVSTVDTVVISNPLIVQDAISQSLSESLADAVTTVGELAVSDLLSVSLSASNQDSVMTQGRVITLDSVSESTSLSLTDSVDTVGRIIVSDNASLSLSESNQDQVSLVSQIIVNDTVSLSSSQSLTDEVLANGRIVTGDSVSVSESTSNPDVITLAGYVTTNDAPSLSTSQSLADQIQIGELQFSFDAEKNIDSVSLSRSIQSVRLSRGISGSSLSTNINS